MENTMPDEKHFWRRDFCLLLSFIYQAFGEKSRIDHENMDTALTNLCDWVIRIPAKRPRQVYLSDIARKRILPPYEIKGLNNLCKNLTQGRNLLPYLGESSRNIRPINPPKKRFNTKGIDHFFADWGLLHFHLGQDLANQGKVTRTKYVAIAHIDDSNALIIDIVPHGIGFADVWGKVDFFETIKRNWPGALEGHLVRGLPDFKSKPLSAIEIVNRRKKHINSFVDVNNQSYFPLGGGIMTNGSSMRARRMADEILDELDYIEKDFSTRYPNHPKEFLAVHNQGNCGIYGENTFLMLNHQAKLSALLMRLQEDLKIFTETHPPFWWTPHHQNPKIR